MYWYENLIGKPWKAKPTPPDSFNCGELARYVYKTMFGFDTPAIFANADSLRECIANLSLPSLYGYEALPSDAQKRPFDAVFLRRSTLRDHMAILVEIPQGLGFLHCAQNTGVVVETEFELKFTTGCLTMEYFRHKNITAEMAYAPYS